MSPIDLSNYVDVKERIRQFYERFPDGRLVTVGVKVSDEPDGTPRVWVEAAAYRTPDDALPGRGWSWMVLPGNTNYTRGSEIENTETSAWGRAIGALGIGIAGGIASQDEVRAKEGEADRPAPIVRPAIEPQSNGSIYGVVQVKPEWLSDLELRSTSNGMAIGFKLKDGRKSIKVRAHGAFAVALADIRRQLVDRTVTCWGTMQTTEFTPKGTTRDVSYPVLVLSRIKGPFGELPEASAESVEPATDPVVTGDVDYDDDKLWEKVPEVGAPAA
jgi:hypothetical protein